MKLTDYKELRYREWEVKETEQTKNNSFLGNVQFWIIYWIVKRKFSKKNPPKNYFDEYLYRFRYLIPTSLYVINQLKKEGFQVAYYIITEDPKTKGPRKYLLEAIIHS